MDRLVTVISSRHETKKYKARPTPLFTSELASSSGCACVPWVVSKVNRPKYDWEVVHRSHYQVAAWCKCTSAVAIYNYKCEEFDHVNPMI
jgi:hypothetical protein